MVGLERYAQMIYHRFPDNGRIVELSNQIGEFSLRMSSNLIYERLLLQESGEVLGTVERGG